MNNALSIIQSLENLKSLTKDNTYSIVKIEWWLLKYKGEYQYTNSVIDAIPSSFTYPRISPKYQEEFNFKDLYERLEEVSICYKNETHFKEQLAVYNKVKNNVSELNNWLATHYLDAGKQQSKFRILFADNRELIDYSFKIHLPTSLNLSVIVEANEFQYSLQFLNILERSKKILISGVVKLITDLEVFEERRITEGNYTRISPAFKRQKIVISTNDEHLNEHLIRFVNGKTELLKEVKVGRKIKVYTSLRGGEWENEHKELEYKHSLLGWDIEQ